MRVTHSEIISRLPGSFANAVKSGDLLYFPSTVSKHIDSEIEVRTSELLDKCPSLTSPQYVIRLCPALQKKCTSDNPQGQDAMDVDSDDKGKEKKILDPFAPPYNEKLYVGELKDEESEEEFVILVRFTSLCCNKKPDESSR